MQCLFLEEAPEGSIVRDVYNFVVVVWACLYFLNVIRKYIDDILDMRKNDNGQYYLLIEFKYD